MDYGEQPKGGARTHRRALITYLGAYLFAISIAVRGLSASHRHPSRWTVAGLLLAFLILMVIEPWFCRHSHRYTHLYLAAQTLIISSLLYVPPKVDFFAALFVALSLQAMHAFPGWTGFRWLGAFAVITSILMVYQFGWREGLPYILSYTIAYLLVGSFVALLRQAETAREESQELVAELQAAHRELQVYVDRAEELAKAAENKRAKEALEAAHAFQQAVIDGVAEAIMVIGTDYRVGLMNRAAREFCLGDVAASESLLCYQVSRRREIPCGGTDQPCPLNQVRQSGQPTRVLHKHYQADGEQRSVEVIASPLWGVDGTFRGIIECVRDITEPLQAQEALQEYTERLRALAAQLDEVTETQRRQLARELHDQVGQNLTALGINLNILQMQIPEETASPVRSRLDDSMSLVQQTAERVRDVMADLRPPALDDYGLVAALRWYGEQFARRTGIAIAVEGEEPIPRLVPRVENALFRIAQEALTNVAKHAHATHAKVAVEVGDGGLRLIVADDGIGFDSVHLAEPDAGRGWGLLTMSERAEAVGGHCSIESSPGQGAQVVVEVAR
jgi:signal transduction histidine kinase